MPECNLCLSPISPDDTECPVCGNPVTKEDQLDPLLAKIEDRVHATLISANLKKLRGDLDGAIHECISAMRINPNSLEAHSMLGDIYRDKGNIEEAERWYQLALDLNPDSNVDKLRLEQLKTIDASKAIKQEHAASPAIRNWLIAGGISVIILVLLIILILPLIHNAPAKESDKVQIPSIQGKASQIRRPSKTTEEQQVVQPLSSEQEAAIVKNLNYSSLLTNSKIQIVNMTIDPRYNWATITYISQLLPETSQSLVLARNCVVIAQEAFRHNPSLTQVTVRALFSVPVAGRQSAQVIFIADVEQSKAMTIDPLTADLNQLVGVMNTVWTHPSIIPIMKPEAPPANHNSVIQQPTQSHD